MYFSSCENCEAKCCDGKHGSVFSQIILEDFEKVYKNFPILFIFGDLGYLKPVILLSNGKSHCPYIENFKCTIYDERPNVCKNYPLSPNLDNQIYYDLNCPAICEDGFPLVKNNKINSSFDSSILYDYQDKYIKTHLEFEKFNNMNNFELTITINGNKFYKYIGTETSFYLEMHFKSLQNLKNYF